MIFTLFDPTATRTGHLHRVSYEPQGDGSVKVTTDDCVCQIPATMTEEDARIDWRRRLGQGFRAHPEAGVS